MRTTTDIRYLISDERLRQYARVPLIDRLRWLDELVRFTQMWRDAPEVEHTAASPGAAADDEGARRG